MAQWVSGSCWLCVVERVCVCDFLVDVLGLWGGGVVGCECRRVLIRRWRFRVCFRLWVRVCCSLLGVVVGLCLRCCRHGSLCVSRVSVIEVCTCSRCVASRQPGCLMRVLLSLFPSLCCSSVWLVSVSLFLSSSLSLCVLFCLGSLHGCRCFAGLAG